MPLVKTVIHQCVMDEDCEGITCEVQTPVDTNNPLLVRVRIDACKPSLILSVNKKKWEDNLSSVSGTYLPHQSKPTAQLLDKYKLLVK